MKAQAHEMENKIKTGNSSMFCNKENKKKCIIIFSNAVKSKETADINIYLISVSVV